MTAIDSPIPTWIKRWLGIATFILFFDGSFCVLRPHSFPDGCLSALYLPYRLYIQVDKHYADKEDTFVLVQGMLNFVEGSINVAVLLQLFSNIRWGKLMTIASSVMTCWKSLLFLLVSYDLADENRHVDDWFYNIALVLLPTLIFILVPAYATCRLMRDFADVPKKKKEIKEADHDETNTVRRYNLRNR